MNQKKPMLDQPWQSVTVGDTLTTDVDGNRVRFTITGIELVPFGELYAHLTYIHQWNDDEPTKGGMAADNLRYWLSNQVWTKETR